MGVGWSFVFGTLGFPPLLVYHQLEFYGRVFEQLRLWEWDLGLNLGGKLSLLGGASLRLHSAMVLGLPTYIGRFSQLNDLVTGPLFGLSVFVFCEASFLGAQQ